MTRPGLKWNTFSGFFRTVLNDGGSGKGGGGSMRRGDWGGVREAVRG